MENYLAITRSDLLEIEETLAPNFRDRDIGYLVFYAMPYLFGFAGFALLIYIVFAGYTLLMSRGDPKGVSAAQAKITYAIVGFIVIFTSYWIVGIVARILGISQIQTIFQP